MIKRRIRERQFDDVIRQRDLDALPFAPSKMLELSDAKSSKSLAELYEDEYQAARGDAPQAESDVKLANEHAAIASDMEALLNKLEALSNAHRSRYGHSLRTRCTARSPRKPHGRVRCYR